MGVSSWTMQLTGEQQRRGNHFYLLTVAHPLCLSPIFNTYCMGSMYLWKVVFAEILIAFCFFGDTFDFIRFLLKDCEFQEFQLPVTFTLSLQTHQLTK